MPHIPQTDYLFPTDWQVVVAGQRGRLQLRIDLQGTVTGTISVNQVQSQISGFWDEGQYRIMFMKVPNPVIPQAVEIFTAYWIHDPAVNPKMDYLTGYYEAFAGPARRTSNGWLAETPSLTRPDLP